MRTPVVALIRVSKEAQAAEGRAGIARQQIAIDQAVSRHDLKVVHTVTLKGVSGSVVGHTPEWGEIRRLLDNGTIKGVVIDAINRLCRASELDLSVLTDIQRVGGTIYTPVEVRALSSSSDGLIAGILALLAGQEKLEIARRANAGREALRRQGRWTSDPAMLPPGIHFDKASGEWSVVEPEISIMREAFRRIGAREISTSDMAHQLGVARKTLRGRLENPLYRGWMVSETRATYDPITKKRTVYERAPEDVIRVQVFDEPPIPVCDTDAVDKRLASNRRVYNAKGRLKGPDVHYLRKLLICAGCGAPLSTIRRKRGHGYGCRSTVNGGRKAAPGSTIKPCRVGEMHLDEVHNVVVDALVQWMATPGWIETAILGAVKAAKGDVGDDPWPKVKARLGALADRREKLVDLYLSGLVSRDEVERRKPLIDRQIEAAEVELAELDKRNDGWIDQLFARAQTVIEAINALIADLPFNPVDGDADIDEQIDQLEADEAERAKVLGQWLRDLGGLVVVLREPGIGNPVQVIALQLDPSRLVELTNRLHQNGGLPW